MKDRIKIPKYSFSVNITYPETGENFHQSFSTNDIDKMSEVVDLIFESIKNNNKANTSNE